MAVSAGTSAVYRLTYNISLLDFVIVSKAYRRQGIATSLIQASMEQVKGTNVIVDANPNYISLYTEKFGFQGSQPMYELRIIIPPKSECRKFCHDCSVIDVTLENITEVMDYDRTLHPLGRRVYFEQMLLDEGNTSLCSIVDGKVNGLLEYSPGELVLNALYADSPAVAKNLLSALLSSFSSYDSPTHPEVTKIRAGLLEYKLKWFKGCLTELGVLFEGPYLDSIRMFSQEKIENIAYEKIYCLMYDVYIV